VVLGTFASICCARGRIWWEQIRVAAPAEAPWYVDLPNINPNSEDLVEVRQRIGQSMDASSRDGTRLTQNLDLRSREAPQCRGQEQA